MNTNTKITAQSNTSTPISTAKLIILAVIAVLFLLMGILSKTNPDLLPAVLDLNMSDSAVWQHSNI